MVYIIIIFAVKHLGNDENMYGSFNMFFSLLEPVFRKTEIYFLAYLL